MKSLYQKLAENNPTSAVGRSGISPAPQMEDNDPSLLGDAFMGVPRGVEDFAHSVYNLTDYFAFDSLPDWDDQRLLGHSKTWAGELTNGITQFATGFIPAIGIAGRLGKVGRLANVAKTSPKIAKYSKFAAAGAMSDFVSFEGNEERLSNLIQSHPFFENPVSEFLAAEGNDGEIEGRFKNVVEGLLLEAGIGSAFKAAGFAKDMLFGVKNIKNQRKMTKIGETEDNTFKKLLGDYEKNITNKFDASFDDTQASFKAGDIGELTEFNADFQGMAKQAFKQGEDVTDAGTVVKKFLSSNLAQRSRYTNLLRRLHDKHGAELSDVNFKLEDELADRTGGFFDENTNTITLPKKQDTISNSRVLVHELIHAITSKKLTKSLGEIQNLSGGDYYRALNEFVGRPSTPENEQIQNLVSAYLGVIENSRAFNILTKSEYVNIKDFPAFKQVDEAGSLEFEGQGILNALNENVTDALDPSTSANLFNIHEFVAEAMSNPAFARELNATKNVNNSSLWTQFKEALKTLFKDTDEGTMTVLDDVIDFTTDIRDLDLKDIPDGLNGGKVTQERMIDEAGQVKNSLEEVSGMNPRSVHKQREAPQGNTNEFLSDAALERSNLLKEISGLADFLKLGDGQITGGTQAINSAAKNIKSTNGAWALITAMSRHLDEVGVKKTYTAKDLNAVTEEYADILGGDINVMKAHIEKIKNSPEKMRQFRNEQAASKEIIGTLSRLAVDKAKEIKAQSNMASAQGAKDKQVLEAELMTVIEQLTEAQRVWSLFGREAGLNLVQRRLLGGRYGFHVRKNIGIDTNNASLDEVHKFRKKQMSGVIGQLRMEKLVDLLVSADTDRGVADALRREGQTDSAFDEMVKQVATNNRKVKGSRMFEIGMEYWMNSLLSGLSTQVVNVMGNVLNATMRQLELIGGAALTGDMQTAKAAFKYAFDMESLRESVKYSVRAFKNDDSILMEGSRIFDDDQFRTYAIQSDRQDAVGSMINILGHIVRAPTRALLTGDEFFKQMSYRSNAKMELAMEAMSKGISDGMEMARYVDERFKDLITDGGHAYSEAAITREAFEAARQQGLTYGTKQAEFVKKYKKEHVFDETKGKLAERSVESAKQTTFTNRGNEGVVNKVGNVVGYGLQQFPILRLVVPFLNTPTNILKAGIVRSPFGVAKPIMDVKKLLKDDIRQGVFSKDPVTRARAVGQLSTGVGVTAMISHYIMNGYDESKGAMGQLITGGGPSNRDQAAVMKKAGWQPYSIRIGDKYWSYQRLDPIATAVGLMADMNDAQRFDELEPDQIGRMFAIASTSLANNITSKSYLKGIHGLMEAMFDAENRGQSFLGGLSGGFVPSFVNQSMNYQGSRELYEARNIFDYMLKRTPYADDLDMPKKRNFMGEVVSVESLGGVVGVVNPFRMSTAKKNLVDQELANLEHGFTKPSHRFMGTSTSLKNIYGSKNNRQAYDRLLELTSTSKIGGRTLRQRMDELVRSPSYQNAPDFNKVGELGKKTPRIRAIQQLISAYRATAMTEVISEYPELQQLQKQVHAGRLDYLR